MPEIGRWGKDEVWDSLIKETSTICSIIALPISSGEILMSKLFPPLLVLGFMLSLPRCSTGQDKVDPAKKWELTGRVTTENGDALSGVQVQNVVTDENGHYNYILPLPSYVAETDMLIRFRHSGYRTVTKVIPFRTHKLDIVMQAGDNKWILPSCNSVPSFDSLSQERLTLASRPMRFGALMKFLVPNEGEIEELDGPDAWSININLSTEQGIERMTWGTGPMWIGIPPTYLMSSSTEYRERELDCPGGGGIDLRGMDQNGKRWRFTNCWIESISYKDASDRAASFYDSIIDGMCLELDTFQEIEKGLK